MRAAPAIDRGLLWEVRRGSHVSHLYGTLHVGKPQWVQPGPALHRALDASDVLALEIDPDDPQLAAALSAAGPSLFVPNASPDARQALQLRLQQAMDRACVPHAALAALHPLLQAVTLTVLEARWLGMDAQYAQERMLSTWAADHGLPLVSLESAAQQVALLLPDDAEAARMSLQQLLTQLENGSGRRVLQRLAGAWEHGDLAMLADFERWCECAATETERDFMRKLNDDRNGPMADRIAALHNTGKRVLVAVGALHMTGPRSLPKLLAQRGFEVRRIRFER
ncbi:MAG: TraB/GumN family protein [Rubrivivax sp.]